MKTFVITLSAYNRREHNAKSQGFITISVLK